MNTRFYHLLLATSLACSLSTTAFGRQPNIILIMADDLGYETLGCNGGESYQTPELDRLAATGMRFDNCYVQPVCTPTRVELMTGQSNIRNYIEFGVIDPKVTTFGHLFKQAGYATAIAGKWQLGREKDLPQRMGFDEACLWQHMRRPSRYANPGLEYNGQERDFRNGEYGPTLVNDFALDFITRHKDRPFLLYYPMMLTHAPYQPTPDSPDWDPEFNGGEKKLNDRKYFADMVAYMDKMVGRVVDKLEELDLREDTLIIFLGDNGCGGGMVSQLNGQPYRGGKGKASARGMHVPLVVNGPGRVATGVSDEMVASVDFLPTLCAAAGIQPPDDVPLDGMSFFAQAAGQDAPPRGPLYFWYPRGAELPRGIEFAMTKTHKLYRDGRFYNLADDPFEDGKPMRVADLTGATADAAKELQQTLDRYADARPPELKHKSQDTKPRRQRGGRRANRQRRAARSE